MDRAEAIAYWEGLHKTFSHQLEKEENHFGRMHLQTTLDVLDTTIAALREQEQREQGCEYCREYKSIVEENGDFISLDATTSKGVFLEACTCDVVLEAKVPFCPMCGRKLKEGAEG